MKSTYLKFIKPMLWFWIAILISMVSLVGMNYTGYRLFSNNNNTWSNNGPGYHK